MANAIDLVLKYLPILDEQYKLESRSAILDTPPAFIRETAEANKFKIAKITTQGLANYSRGTGFVDGRRDTDVGRVHLSVGSWSFFPGRQYG